MVLNDIICKGMTNVKIQDYNPFKKTAIIRNKLSKPMQILREKKLLRGSVLDYGCGHG